MFVFFFLPFCPLFYTRSFNVIFSFYFSGKSPLMIHGVPTISTSNFTTKQCWRKAVLVSLGIHYSSITIHLSHWIHLSYMYIKFDLVSLLPTCKSSPLLPRAIGLSSQNFVIPVFYYSGGMCRQVASRTYSKTLAITLCSHTDNNFVTTTMADQNDRVETSPSVRKVRFYKSYYALYFNIYSSVMQLV